MLKRLKHWIRCQVDGEYAARCSIKEIFHPSCEGEYTRVSTVMPLSIFGPFCISQESMDRICSILEVYALEFKEPYALITTDNRIVKLRDKTSDIQVDFGY